MDSLLITGGNPLKGEIYVSGAKNSALPIMACALLTGEKLKIHNIPRLTDVYTMGNLLQNHGALVEISENYDNLSISIDCSNINNLVAPYDIVSKMRASIWVLGPIISRFGYTEVSFPGGCAIGSRQIDLHLKVLESMGVEIQVNDGYIKARSKGRLNGIHFKFNKVSVGATINAIMAATLAKGETLLSNCAIEPEIGDLCNCLTMMGAKIEGIATRELRIVGSSRLSGGEYKVMPDRIEAGTYMIASAITKGDMVICGIDSSFIKNLISKLIQVGLEISNTDYGIRVRYVDKLRSTNIETNVYPGFATDLQAQFMSLMSISKGVSVITENIFENRFMHVSELCRMGANITINGNSAIVNGVRSLSGTEVVASDLRGSVCLVLAALIAKGKTKIQRVYHLDRGYQLLEQKLSKCGAEILRIPEKEKY